jgi:hypothetical protein
MISELEVWDCFIAAYATVGNGEMISYLKHTCSVHIALIVVKHER